MKIVIFTVAKFEVYFDVKAGRRNVPGGVSLDLTKLMYELGAYREGA